MSANAQGNLLVRIFESKLAEAAPKEFKPVKLGRTTRGGSGRGTYTFEVILAPRSDVGGDPWYASVEWDGNNFEVWDKASQEEIRVPLTSSEKSAILNFVKSKWSPPKPKRESDAERLDEAGMDFKSAVKKSVFPDSLTPEDVMNDVDTFKRFPALIEAAKKAMGGKWKPVNRGRSFDTTHEESDGKRYSEADQSKEAGKFRAKRAAELTKAMSELRLQAMGADGVGKSIKDQLSPDTEAHYKNWISSAEHWVDEFVREDLGQGLVALAKSWVDSAKKGYSDYKSWRTKYFGSSRKKEGDELVDIREADDNGPKAATISKTAVTFFPSVKDLNYGRRGRQEGFDTEEEKQALIRQAKAGGYTLFDGNGHRYKESERLDEGMSMRPQYFTSGSTTDESVRDAVDRAGGDASKVVAAIRTWISAATSQQVSEKESRTWKIAIEHYSSLIPKLQAYRKKEGEDCRKDESMDEVFGHSRKPSKGNPYNNPDDPEPDRYDVKKWQAWQKRNPHIADKDGKYLADKNRKKESDMSAANMHYQPSGYPQDLSEISLRTFVGTSNRETRLRECRGYLDELKGELRFHESRVGYAQYSERLTEARKRDIFFAESLIQKLEALPEIRESYYYGQTGIPASGGNTMIEAFAQLQYARARRF